MIAGQGPSGAYFKFRPIPIFQKKVHGGLLMLVLRAMSSPAKQQRGLPAQTHSPAPQNSQDLGLRQLLETRESPGHGGSSSTTARGELMQGRWCLEGPRSTTAAIYEENLAIDYMIRRASVGEGGEARLSLSRTDPRNISGRATPTLHS